MAVADQKPSADPSGVQTVPEAGLVSEAQLGAGALV
jgi:hypothetical protein